MQHNAMLMANVEIDQAQRQARARTERRTSRARSGRGAVAALVGRLRRR